MFDVVRGARTIVDQREAEVQFFSRLWRGVGSRAGSSVSVSVRACAVAAHGGKSLVASCRRVCNLLWRFPSPSLSCLVLRPPHSQVIRNLILTSSIGVLFSHSTERPV